MLFYPGAAHIAGNGAGSFLPGFPKRGVLHTTEGASAAGAFSAFRTNNSWPHFTVGREGRVYQHVSIGEAARALRNAPGGTETNRVGAIQIEVVGWASRVEWPLGQIEALNTLMRWLERETGIQPNGPIFGGSEQYGLRNPLEMTAAEWKMFSGWCGHQHVPENTHWDPGAIKLSDLLPQEAPVMIPIYKTNAPPVSLAITPSGKGYIILCADGGVVTFGDAPYLGRIEERVAGEWKLYR